MNKYVFLGTLQTDLEDQLDQEEVKRIIEYYEGYVAEAIDFGKNEEEIFEELGDPHQLAKAIISGLKDIDIEVNEKTTSSWEKDFSSMFEGFSTLSKTVGKEVGKAMKEVGKVINDVSGDVKETFKSYDEDMVKVKIDFDDIEDDLDEIKAKADQFSSSFDQVVEDDQSTEFDREFLIDASELNHFKLKAANILVAVHFVEDTTFKAELLNNENGEYIFNASVKDGTLKLVERKARVYSLLKLKATRLVLHIPLAYKGDVELSCSNSKIDVYGQGVKISNPWKIVCKNGMVNIEDIVMGVVDIRCANGKVFVDDAILYYANIDCQNGMVTYNMAKNPYGKIVNVRCNNGVIKMDDIKTVKGHLSELVPSQNDSKYQLKLEANCNNGIVKLVNFR